MPSAGVMYHIFATPVRGGIKAIVLKGLLMYV